MSSAVSNDDDDDESTSSDKDGAVNTAEESEGLQGPEVKENRTDVNKDEQSAEEPHGSVPIIPSESKDETNVNIHQTEPHSTENSDWPCLTDALSEHSEGLDTSHMHFCLSQDVEEDDSLEMKRQDTEDRKETHNR